MKKIALVLPYFGKLPNYFQKYLTSVKNNPTIDWFIFTDDKTAYDYPSNCKVTYLTFEECCEKFKEKTGYVPIRPYKLCEFKTTYGFVFSDYLVGYDFWGYCDCDVIFGDIRRFISDNILENYEKIGTLGHFTLLANNDKMNHIYKDMIYYEKFNYTFPWRVDKCFNSDEWGGIIAHFQNKNIPQYDIPDLDDILPVYQECFRTTRELQGRKDRQKHYMQLDNYVYKYKNDGTLYRIAYLSGKQHSEEIIYAHFQKRSLTDEMSQSEEFVVYPNFFGYIDDHSLDPDYTQSVIKENPLFIRLFLRTYRRFYSKLRGYLGGLKRKSKLNKID